MRKLIVQEFMTVDGFAAGPSGELDFIATQNVDSVAGEHASDQLRFIETLDTMLLGATTYKMFADYWPQQTTATELIADALNAVPDKVVFSQTLNEAPWGNYEPARIARGSISDEVRRLKAETGKDIVLWGSLSVAQALIRDGLIDEYQFWLCPVAIGKGRPLFSEDLSMQQLRLIEAKPYEAGITRLRFQPVANPASP